MKGGRAHDRAGKPESKKTGAQKRPHQGPPVENRCAMVQRTKKNRQRRSSGLDYSGFPGPAAAVSAAIKD